jgi:trans-aconitate methyltransferase
MSSEVRADAGPSNDGYLAYHAPRFRFLLGLARRMLPDGAERVLDIGPSPLTMMLRQHLPCAVDTLGLESATDPKLESAHYHADLNHPGSLPPALPAYDLIIFAEVLEHLHTSPTLVLDAVKSHLTSRGVLILQTPNAASLPKRLKLLAGRNPYELFREDLSNPGHFREYTLRELRAFANQANLRVVSTFRRFYFDARYAHHEDGVARSQPVLGGLKNLVYRALPPVLREGITVVLRGETQPS